jgi:GSH-dependent disulfide-bond oxidoreductase
MLEETHLAYELQRSTSWRTKATTRPFSRSTQRQDSRNLRPDGPNGTPLALFESGEILLYLAEKTGQFISTDPNTRYETIQWVMWQMGGVGPMFGQVGFFNKSAGKAHEDKRPRDRYAPNQRGCSASSTNGSRAATG